MACHRRLAGCARCACVTAARAPCGRLAAGFFQPISEHGFGVIDGSLVGQHLVETQIVVVQAEQQLTQISPRLDSMPLGAGEDREQDRRPRPRLPAPQKQPILCNSDSGEGWVPFEYDRLITSPTGEVWVALGIRVAWEGHRDYWIDHVAVTTTAIPEPSAMILLLIAVTTMLTSGRIRCR